MIYNQIYPQGNYIGPLQSHLTDIFDTAPQIELLDTDLTPHLLTYYVNTYKPTLNYSPDPKPDKVLQYYFRTDLPLKQISQKTNIPYSTVYDITHQRRHIQSHLPEELFIQANQRRQPPHKKSTCI